MTTADFLLELRSEEIPARMQAGARADLEKLFRKELDAAGLKAGEVTVWSTPRRLALIARALPLATEAVSEEVKGPRTSAPEQALEGFLRKTGLTRDQLTERDGVWFAVTEKPGRATRDVLAEAVPAIIRAFPWPKSQRWGAASLSTESLRWVRPLSGIVAILGDDLVECEIGAVKSGYATRGHRFHCPGEITIGSAHDYADKLRACHVIVDHVEREAMVRDKAKAAAEAAGLVLVEDEGLVIENAGLTEWPVPLLGRFDEAFLDVPPEVIQLTARVNQKYFICRDSAGKLANAFVCTANIEAKDGGAAIVDGNRKVLAARLSDARFFWEQDKKKPLAEQAQKLSRITFHEKLGTVADKVQRVVKLAEWLASEGIVPNCDPALARQAAELCKADLVTEMVGEFPELQGLMGGYYARAEGLPDAVADAIRDHYKPVGQGDDVPTAPVTVAVALADKLDTLVGFFLIDQRPTGSRDPFALRRAALGVLELLNWGSLRVSMWEAIAKALAAFTKQLVSDDMAEASYEAFQTNQKAVFTTLPDFFADRLKVQQREAGVRHDLIDAVFALGGEDDLVRLLARVHALQAFVGTEDGTNLLAGYKRAANILKKEGFAANPNAGSEGEGVVPPTGEEDPLVLVDDPAMEGVVAQFSHPECNYQREPAEQALVDALDYAEPAARGAVESEDFDFAMRVLASLRAPIDSFFDQVTVNDADANKRSSRLALLDRFRAAVHKVADFSRIEG
ncbi:glycyl-tRNA synthetase beta chain [Novosphingobium aromaticivorans DSM 12444]|uniref:Glycine--tRNA ligase beta subunit n=1 Tax=Novosphingobium aromaticivorans (strain ATCC 700278 / DSM 12444 / CCUG 56034 / CIP 105152 / NBRC 16084 / F199) TaxID=279238 RepID=Q2G6H3_NOVAD|nr:glycine--tRNA ligase subunit beta [Novosphingobium aromaticivorans]ABD26550.1 glycyl-tRNA synthetase beta chain [Novosphingobium aromaticivorans DSM 12444]SCY75787.1 glycyl-tRNA synthetase beta chain [Novosphingobium aromaticivorans]